MKVNEKVLVSACLLGEPVRYDGQAKRSSHPVFTILANLNAIIPFCPECAGGLPTPREPAEQQTNGTVITRSNTDVTAHFIKGAQLALALCLKHNIRCAILKEYSPSCGRHFINDGTFTKTRISGLGITSQLLLNNQIAVYSEASLDQFSRDYAL